MKIVEHDKPYSWLQWPVKLTGMETDLHVTAKFFGKAKIDVGAVLQKIRNLYPIQEKYKDIEWEPAIFGNGEDVYVLELTRYPSVMDRVHDLFDLVNDDFPEYRPHITIPKGSWDAVKEGKITPQQVDLTFGVIELHLGKPNG